jgi:hypothetical protein
MSEPRILIRLLRMCFPRNWEFGSFLSKRRNFGGWGWTLTPPPPRYATGCTVWNLAWRLWKVDNSVLNIRRAYCVRVLTKECVPIAAARPPPSWQARKSTAPIGDMKWNELLLSTMPCFKYREFYLPWEWALQSRRRHQWLCRKDVVRSTAHSPVSFIPPPPRS